MKLTGINKIILLFAIFIIGLFFCYKYAFSKTITNYKELSTYNKNLTTNGSYKTQLINLQKKINEITNTGVINNTGTNLSQDKLFQFISSYILQKNMRVNQVPETVISNIGGYDIETNLYRIQGSYQQIICLVYEIEYVQKLAKVSSLKIKKQINRKTKKEYIEASIYLQNIK